MKSLKKVLHRIFIRKRVNWWLKTKEIEKQNKYKSAFEPTLSRTDMEQIAFKICLFSGMRSIWDKDNKEIGQIIETYNLKNYVDDNYETLSKLNIAEQVMNIENHIKHTKPTRVEKCKIIDEVS